jgi:glycosyltransferase involved in cell wall biosynthesis
MKFLFHAYYFRAQNFFQDMIKRSLLKPVALLLFICSFFIVSPVKRYKMLFAAHRFSYFKFIEKKIMAELHEIRNCVLSIMRKESDFSEPVSQNRSLMLKKPKINDGLVTEKGVLLIKFSNTFQYFFQKINCEKLQEHFHIVLEPSWAGYCLPEILAWTLYKEPIIIECSEIKDFEFVKKLNSNLIPVRFGSSDWVDHRLFNYAKKTNPKYDVIYVSNYTSIKRNHIFLKAISQIQKKNYRAALVCNSWGDDKDNVKVLSKFYKLDTKLDIYEALTQQELNNLLADSKVNLLLSLKEGSNRSIFEAFFTNTPGIVLAENLGVNKTYINKYTGRLISEGNLVETLLEFAESWGEYEPRKWAMANISTFKTKEKLDAVLEQVCKETGQPWSEGTFLKVNTPEATYFDAQRLKKLPTSTAVITNFLKH